MPWLRYSRIQSASRSSSVVMRPPSPVVMFFVPYRLNAPCPKLPTRRPPNVAPCAWQASSTTARPCRSAMAMIAVHVGRQAEEVDRA